MPIRHCISDNHVTVTFITPRVSREDFDALVDSLAAQARPSRAWYQILMLGDGVSDSLGYVDQLTLSEALSEACSHFGVCHLALCASSDPEFDSAVQLASLLQHDGCIRAAAFRYLLSARKWLAAAQQGPAAAATKEHRGTNPHQGS